ncbi:MAG: UpxY family transcription antiterminator [Candidatus Omnitrophica bacterium]|nr:UpxY family transcription antiterminator [Candidatus Omnitrophota bacterium]
MKIFADNSMLYAGKTALVVPSPETSFQIAQKNWYALYTKSRHEKLTYRELSKKGIESFLPIRQLKRQWSDRSKTIEEPLFPGYLFVRIPPTEKKNVLMTAGSVCLVGRSAGEPVAIPENEILTVKRFVAEEIQIDPFPYLRSGQRVRVRSGIFKGVEGFIVRKEKNCRLVISLDLLMQSVSTEIDSACVEKI